MIVIPEKVLLESLKLGIEYIRKDYKAHILSESDSWLYTVLHGEKLERYSLFEQGKAVFLAGDEHPRKLDINMFFNASRANIPTIHITLPSENTIHNALGNSGGFRDPIFKSSFTAPSSSDSDGEVVTFKETYNRRFKAQYNVVITSDNTNEVVLIYHSLRSLLISLISHLNGMGLENINLGGRDLQIDPSLVPAGVFLRAISLDFEYDVGAVELVINGTSMVNDLNSTGTPSN